MIELIRTAASALRLPVSIPPHVNQSLDFVHKSVIADIIAFSSNDWDTSKLARFCEELNFAYSSGNFYSCAILSRAIIDHVPPLFDRKDFKIIAANWPESSVKRQMIHLDNVTKQFGHAVLHNQISKNVGNINHTSIDCKQALDTLLRECIRKLQPDKDSSI